MKLNTSIKATPAMISKVVNSEETKSQKIRSLWLMGVDHKEIAGFLSISTNFAFNVISRFGYMGGFDESSVEKKPRGDSETKNSIMNDLRDGMSITDVSRKYRKNYNQVWNYSQELKSK